MNSIKGAWENIPATMENMIAVGNRILIQEDTKEVLRSIPIYNGKRILELTSGIGRFTGLLAEEALHVTAVDFVQEYTEINRRQNGHYNNVTFLCADATELKYPAGSFDLVFSGWMFCNVDDHKMKSLMENTLKWLSPGGHVFFRERCLVPERLSSTDTSHRTLEFKGTNGEKILKPNFVRTAAEYCHLLLDITYDGAGFRGFSLKNSYSFNKHNSESLQVMFLAQRTSLSEMKCTMRKANEIFNNDLLSKMKWAFGHSWQTYGGKSSIKKLISQAGVTSGDKVLNIGCGTGSSAFLLAKYYSTDVHAVDLSTNMICTALERQANLENTHKRIIQFEAVDINEVEFLDGHYDVIYGSNSLFCFKDKERIFEKIHRWLKPGGKLFIAEYCLGESRISTELQKFLDLNAINLVTIENLKGALENAGFSIPSSSMEEDTTASSSLVSALENDLNIFRTTEEAFTKEFSPEEFQQFSTWGTTKVKWMESDQLSWRIFKVKK